MDPEKRLAEATKPDLYEPEKRVRLTKEPINWEDSIQRPANPTGEEVVTALGSEVDRLEKEIQELVPDLLDLSQILITLLAAILVVFLVLPIIIPIILTFFSEPKPLLQESLIDVHREDEGNKSENEVIFSEVEDEKALDVDSLLSSERQK
ncbi:hypothetical protein ACLB2K_073248 [Fragaria x ananassa]